MVEPKQDPWPLPGIPDWLAKAKANAEPTVAHQEIMGVWAPSKVCGVCGLPVGSRHSKEPICRGPGGRACGERFDRAQAGRAGTFDASLLR